MKTETQRTNADLSPTEAIVDTVVVKGPLVFGNEKTGRFLMIGGMVESDPRANGRVVFYDLFLTREQAVQLHADVEKILTQFPPEGSGKPTDEQLSAMALRCYKWVAEPASEARFVLEEVTHTREVWPTHTGWEGYVAVGPFRHWVVGSDNEPTEVADRLQNAVARGGWE